MSTTIQQDPPTSCTVYVSECPVTVLETTDPKGIENNGDSTTSITVTHTIQAPANPSCPAVRSERDPRVFDQPCAQYLQKLGIPAKDGQRINAPYRGEADSESFILHGALWYDHISGKGGNVWELAVLMNNGDRKKALISLYKAAGVPFTEDPKVFQHLENCRLAREALKKVQEAFAITSNTPREVRDYLASRKVGPKSLHHFAYIPKGELAKVLTSEEIALTGLGWREELLIFWYSRGGQPVYYCTRSIHTKEFKKASTASGILEHPIWNHDDLYTKATIIWGEGMFDCTSLIELGYGVAGEITCNPIKDHLEALVTALRWRRKYHPEWEFIICLDNDAPTKDGRHPGNEAAERLGLYLWGKGIDVKLVKHDLGAEKVDINQLHQAGQVDRIHSLIASAKPVSQLFEHDPHLTRRNVILALANGDADGAARLVDLIMKKKKSEQAENLTLAQIIEDCVKIRVPYEDLYDDIEMFLYDGDIYVVHERDYYGDGKLNYDSFKKGNLIDNIRRHQKNDNLRLSITGLDIPAQRPDWRVAKTTNTRNGPIFNLFRPSSLLLQAPVPGTCVPPMWDKVLDNIAGAVEKEWLLNHMAVYVQTLEKAKTIPLFLGPQGTGKTSAMELFGKGIGDVILVGNTLVEGSFNDWLLHAVVVLDELATTQAEARNMKSKMKLLINENQTINAKFKTPMLAELNNYIAITSNEQVTCVPVVIEEDDRRFTVITGGDNQKLISTDWFSYDKLKAELPQFMLYLLSRPIDVRAASIPLMNDTKRELIALSEDMVITVVREFVDAHRGGDQVSGTELCDRINDLKKFKMPLTGKRLASIMKHLGFTPITVHNQNHYQGLDLHPHFRS